MIFQSFRVHPRRLSPYAAHVSSFVVAGHLPDHAVYSRTPAKRPHPYLIHNSPNSQQNVSLDVGWLTHGVTCAKLRVGYVPGCPLPLLGICFVMIPLCALRYLRTGALKTT